MKIFRGTRTWRITREPADAIGWKVYPWPCLSVYHRPLLTCVTVSWLVWHLHLDFDRTSD